MGSARAPLCGAATGPAAASSRPSRIAVRKACPGFLQQPPITCAGADNRAHAADSSPQDSLRQYYWRTSSDSQGQPF